LATPDPDTRSIYRFGLVRGTDLAFGFAFGLALALGLGISFGFAGCSAADRSSSKASLRHRW